MSIRHKLIVPAAYMAIGMCGVYLSMYQISLLRIAQNFELTNFMMGAIVALQFAGLCLPPLFIGTLSDKIGKRGVVLISMPLMILGTFVISMTASLAFFIAGIILIGAGFSVTEATFTAILGAEFQEKSRLHLGISQAIFSIGAVLSPIACEALFNAGYKYNALFGIISAAYLVLFAMFLFTRQRNDARGMASAGARNAVKFFRQKIFIFMAVAMVMYVGAEGTIAFFADSYFELTLGLPEFGALALNLFWAGMIPTRFLLGAVRLKPETVIIGCAAGIAACILVILLAPLQAARLGAFCGLGIFCGPCWPLIMDMAAKKYKANAGTVSNLMMSVGGLGGAVMPVLAGAAISGADFTPVFFISGACAIIMAASIYPAGKAIDDKKA